MRGRKANTIQNLQRRRDAELALTRENNPITWLDFLKQVSHLNDHLVAELNDQFHANGDRVDDPRITLDHDDALQNCIRCQLEITQRFHLECGDVNVCERCIVYLKANQPAFCPNVECGEAILPTTNARPIVIR